MAPTCCSRMTQHFTTGTTYSATYPRAAVNCYNVHCIAMVRARGRLGIFAVREWVVGTLCLHQRAYDPDLQSTNTISYETYSHRDITRGHHPPPKGPCRVRLTERRRTCRITADIRTRHVSRRSGDIAPDWGAVAAAGNVMIHASVGSLFSRFRRYPTLRRGTWTIYVVNRSTRAAVL